MLSTMIAVMLILVLAVIATATGVLYWFFRRLHRIETDLWGEQRQEASKTVHQDEASTPEQTPPSP